MNANGTVRSAGQASARLSGYGPEEQIGHSAFEHLHADDVAAAHAMFAECLTHTGVPTTGNFGPTQDGTWVTIEATAVNRLPLR